MSETRPWPLETMADKGAVTVATAPVGFGTGKSTTGLLSADGLGAAGADGFLYFENMDVILWKLRHGCAVFP